MKYIVLSAALLLPAIAGSVDLTIEDRKILMILTLFQGNKEMVYHIGLSDEGAKALDKHVDAGLARIKEDAVRGKDEICAQKHVLKDAPVTLSEQLSAKEDLTKGVQKEVANLTEILSAQDRATLDAWIAETTEFTFSEGLKVDPLKDGTISADLVIARMCRGDT